MPNTVNEVVSGVPLVTGGILVAPTGTALPTDTTTALNAAFKSLGYISDDGLTETVDRSTDKIKAWGGSTIKVVQSEYGVSYQFTIVQSLNSDANKLVYGDTNVALTAATSSSGALTTIALNKNTLPHKAYVFEIKDGNARVRICVPDGQVSDLGDVVYKDDEIVAYEVTVETFEDGSGNNAYKYLNDGRPTA